MLFDLRSRGRRRTVQGVYLGLAVLMGGGLVLFGVGTGSGLGGLLNAFTGNGSSNAANTAVSAQVQQAIDKTKKNPTSVSAWAGLVSARYEDASTNGYNSTTGTYTTRGKQDLTAATVAWQRYLKLTKSPTADVSTLAGRAYAVIANYADSAAAWEYETLAAPNGVRGYECLAMSAYAAGQTRKGDLASAKAVSMVAASQRKSLTTTLSAPKTNPALAASC
jgi:hypothetical protein